MDTEIKKKINILNHEAKQKAKLDYCVYCGKKTTSFCKSHTIPRFVLKYISDNGMVLKSYHYTYHSKIGLLDEESGIGSAATFQIICRECDSKIFQDYEDASKLVNEPTNKQLAEIFLKNTLLFWYKRNIEVELYKEIENIASTKSDDFSHFHAIKKNEINEFDLKEIRTDFKKAKTIIDKNLKSGFKLIFFHKCDYIVPIAYQGNVCLYSDLHSQIINDVYNYSKEIKLQYLSICVFPLKDESIIIVFRHKDDTNYKSFERQFNKLSLEDKEKLISFIIFNYTEDFFISKSINEELLNNNIISNTAENNTDIYATSIEDLNRQQLDKRKELSNYVTFPNLLGKENSINNQQQQGVLING